MLEVVTTDLKYTIRPILAYERHPCGSEPCSAYTRVFSLSPSCLSSPKWEEISFAIVHTQFSSLG